MSESVNKIVDGSLNGLLNNNNRLINNNNKGLLNNNRLINSIS
jgi:hypothetical protein